MNLFNYLMAKKGHNTSVRDDLLAYLLGKRTPKEVKTATGTTISITDATREKIVSLTLSKESTQTGTPTPENPVEVKTVKGDVGIAISDGTNTRNYTIPLGNNEICGIGNYKDELIVDKNGHCWLNKKIGKMIFDGTENWQMSSSGTAYSLRTSYTEFYYIQSPGNTNEQTAGFCNYFIPSYVLGGNERIGLRFNGDEGLIVCREENMKTIEQFKQLLSTNNMVLYGRLDEPQLIDLNYTVDMTLFKGINNISNSEDMDMTLKYY